ncbi:hypothetical protein SAY87_004734 [Trapa incisa]|uniref:Uncharacterized protein n=1 Tax=Trapa incisa TaxID=236973 RepID=A0AAN7JQ58_9MYRT|nr:hypothetical protein SAY87_004734 [Trapa incisa]
MGGCLSDVKGGQQAIGGVSRRGGTGGGGGFGGQNDAVDLFFRARGQQALFTPLELSLSASKLRDRDILSKSDPMVVVYLRKRDGILEELGRTEVVLNSLDPAWIHKVSISYQFEMVQNLVFHVYDIDTRYHNLPTKDLNLGDQEFLGEATCMLSEVVTKQSRSLTLKLLNEHGQVGSRNLGTLTVIAEEPVASRSVVDITLCCTRLVDKNLFSKSDPFLKISKVVESGGLIPICKTEVVNNETNPTWRPITLSMRQFGTKDNPLIIECFDFNSSGNHSFIGKLEKSMADLERLHKTRTGANFVLPPSNHSHEKVLKGQLFVHQFNEHQQFCFLDYISSGFELNFMVALDFTASNGNPRNPDSLHYMDPNGNLNSYQQAIMEVGQVLQFYDSDRRFPAWGFGGRTYNGSVSHCFDLSSYAHEVEGIEGIMAAYSNALHNVYLAGPTLFGPVINQAAQIAADSVSYNKNKYYVLLIVTDGVLTDLQETKDALVRASDLPLSVLIVGVGSAEFKQMQILDADKGNRLESSTGRVATRDIVQFVPMRDVYDGQISVVQALLEELPNQFLGYMLSRNIKPLSHSDP